MAELPDALYDEIRALCADGDLLAKEEKYAGAIQFYERAWNLLPEPRADWDTATWILAAIGDVKFFAGDFDGCRQVLQEAMHCPGAIGDPFLHLRLGQSELEVGNRERAADELARAYMGAGKDIFDQDDPRYFQFVKTVLKEPDGGW